MKEYPKIQTIFKRDMSNKGKIIEECYSLPEIEYLKNNKWIFTEKIDGTNVRIEWERDMWRLFSGRTDKSQMPIFLTRQLEELFPLKKMNKMIIPEVNHLCLYGEGYGAKIQKGGGNYNSYGVDFILFDVLVDGWWLRREDIENIAMSLGIVVVPIIGTGTLQDGIEIVRHNLTSKWGNFTAEGLVMKSEVELKTRMGNRIITKIKHRDFN